MGATNDSLATPWSRVPTNELKKNGRLEKKGGLLNFLTEIQKSDKTNKCQVASENHHGVKVTVLG